MTTRRAKVLAGAAVWALVAVGLLAVARANAAELRGPLGKLGRFLWHRPTVLQVELTGPLRVGDPVLDGERRYLGRVAAIFGDSVSLHEVSAVSARYTVSLVIDPEAAPALPPEPSFRTRTAPRDGKWVLETLLPPHKREMVADELSRFARVHRRDLETFARPIAEDVIEHAMEVLEANLKHALDAHEPQIQALLSQQRGLIQQEVVPVLKRELGPSAKKKADPILREIGRELWNELPMWSLGWNAFVDTLPGTSKRRVDAWWSQFLEEKAIPIVAAHEKDLLRALEELIEEGARSREVRRALGQATRRLARDPQFKALIRAVLEDALVRPFDLKALVEKVIKDPVHQQRFEALSDAFGPTLQRIGRRLTIDEETGRIDPDLARVLRRVVFKKDARWVELRAPIEGRTAPSIEREF